jgi:hypothetical protein
MKNPLSIWQSLAATGFLVTGALAQDATNGDANRLGLSFRLGFNIDARFKNLGGFASTANTGPPAGGGADRTYDDGFVRVDSSGNANGFTWNWGYQDAAQVQGDTIAMHAGSSPADGVSKQDGDPQPGFELSYERRLGWWGRASWGFEAAFGFTDVEVRDNRALSGNATLLTDAYSLGGVVPPPAPYSGSFNGPGALIGDLPTRTLLVTAGGAQISGQRKLDAELYTLRLGPCLEIPMTSRFTARVGAGVAFGFVDSEFSFAETVTLAGGPSVSRSGASQKNDSLLGAYAGAQFSYRVFRSASVFTGAQFQYLEDFKQQAGGKEAKLDLGASVFLSGGLNFQF